MANKSQISLSSANKRYFSIGEVSSLCKIKPHVLRYWEQEFRQLKPVTRTGGRRYYQPKDIDLVNKIRTLLYEEGFTIAGAKQKLHHTVLNDSIDSTKDTNACPKENPITALICSLEEILKDLS